MLWEPTAASDAGIGGAENHKPRRPIGRGDFENGTLFSLGPAISAANRCRANLMPVAGGGEIDSGCDLRLLFCALPDGGVDVNDGVIDADHHFAVLDVHL